MEQPVRLDENKIDDFVDRRENERIKCRMDALHNTQYSDLFFMAEVCNYSKNGLYFESNVDLQPGDNISLLVEKQLTEGTSLMDVKVVWRKKITGSSFELGYGALLQPKRDLEYIKNKLNRNHTK
jgi:hypothetical protein